ncbi:MAG: hypothetical protein HY934_03490 [Candidatus Firestonebacteria bacterium]|nr:hypothetical protein [Candidatus Firestonebacteria bacterium]
MLKKFGKFIIGIFLIPACIGFSKGYITLISSLKSLSQNQLYFIYGLISYLIVHIIFRKPLSIYVFGHELTHAFWTKIFGGDVKDMKVSGEGGEVKISKSNFFISLAPYFFPIYTLIILIIFGILSLVLNNYAQYINYFLFLLGLTLSFHILLTIEMIRTDQPDIKENGFIFSVSLIYFINLVIISALSNLIFIKEYSFLSYIQKSASESQKLYIYIYYYCINNGTKVFNYLKDLKTIYSA